MSLTIYNTLTGKYEEFVPINPPKVNIYTCGVTVYDDSHVGHGRSLIVFDILRRYLEKLGYRVNFVRNFTDVDDKIINRAKEEKKDYLTIANRYIARYYIDMENINVKPANVEPRVTEHIKEIIDLIKALINKGVAYESEGDVYFSVSSYKEYGKLSKRSIEEMEAGARIEPSEKKKNPLDFALWKSAKPNEPYWDSPWGPGRPGWHTECVAMIFKHLGESIDIHGGGIDLIFPHHENEIAQAESITNKPFARYWIHNGLVTVQGKKMSKSLGNFVTLRDIYTKYHPDILRLLIIFTHYRSPLDFSWEKMEETKNAYKRILSAIEDFNIIASLEIKDSKSSEKPKLYDITKQTEEAFYKALSDDFNTAIAISKVFDLISDLNKIKTEIIKRNFVYKEDIESYKYAIDFIVNTLSEIFGFFEDKAPEEQTKKELEAASSYNEALIELLIEVRSKARKEKLYSLADDIRDKLLSLGIKLEDIPGKTIWKIEK